MKLINLAQIKDGKLLRSDVDALQVSMAALTGGEEAQSIGSLINAAKEEAEAYADSHELTSSVTNADASLSVNSSTTNNNTAYSVGVAVSSATGNILELANDGLKVIPTQYTLTRQTNADNGYLATYQLFAGNVAVGDKINIPKDYLVKSASVNVITVADTPVTGNVGDKYIDFIINTVGNDETPTHLYVNLNDLTDTYVGSDTLEGSQAPTEITVNISNTNVVSAALVNSGVTTAKIADANITAPKLATNSVTTVKIVDGNVTAAKLASDSVTTVKIVDGNVTAAKLGTDSVTTVKIANSSVTLAKLGTDVTDAISNAELTAKAYTDVLALSLADSYERFAITSTTATTTFTLTSTPNAEKLIMYINHVPYLEDEGMFTVNRSTKVVTWVAGSSAGGFDITSDVTDEVFIKYKTYVIPAVSGD